MIALDFLYKKITPFSENFMADLMRCDRLEDVTVLQHVKFFNTLKL